MATATHGSTMSKTEFVKSAPYIALTARQKQWIESFIETQDAALATRKIYGGNDVYIAMFSRKLETSSRIIAALDLYYGRSPREKFLRDLQNDIVRSTGIAKVQARRLFAQVTGLIDGSPSAESEHPVCKVGDIVLVDGVKHRVTAIDASGRPTDGEPL